MIKLWNDDAIPYFNKESGNLPYMEEFLVDDTTRPCVLVFPGGGYEHLSEHEGKTMAEYFNAHGYHAFVLHYRLAPYHRHPAMLCDALRSIRTIRHFAERYHVDPKKIAICGFSAGGHLAGAASTLFDHPFEVSDDIDKESARPDAAILCYGVLSLCDGTHPGSRKNLLEGYSDEEYTRLCEYLSAERHVTPDTPPMFLWHASDDPAVPAENSLHMALSLQAQHIPYALHIFPSGGHGKGLAPSVPYTNLWGELCCQWLKIEQNF